jgi:hypothetical protein
VFIWIVSLAWAIPYVTFQSPPNDDYVAWHVKDPTIDRIYLWLPTTGKCYYYLNKYLNNYFYKINILIIIITAADMNNTINFVMAGFLVVLIALCAPMIVLMVVFARIRVRSCYICATLHIFNVF